MPDFNIVKEITPKKSFRVASVMGKFDLQTEHIKEKFKGSIDIDNEWQVGVIVGHSGTGKSTIARELFKSELISGYKYSSDNILDDMPREKSIEEITKTFNSVGFSSPPSWLKPFSVLSNGEKMRVDLARAILEDQELIVFDEFTSVVDRTVAKIGSFAVSKAIRKTKKKFIAVSCHDDILEWLEPDWVFNTNTMNYQYTRGCLQRPKIELTIHKHKGLWNLFRKYHYLNTDINKSSDQFICCYGGVPVAYHAVLPLLSGKVKKGKMSHRLVTLPDYQGVGIGVKLQETIAIYYKKNGFSYYAKTSNPALMTHRKRSSKWKLTNSGHTSPKCKDTKEKSLGKTRTLNRLTTSWKFIG